MRQPQGSDRLRLLKTTTGAATYGGAGVAALSGGRFLALWFAAGNGGAANLKGRIFSATGVPGAVLNIGTSHVVASAPSVPTIAVAPDGRIVAVTDGFSGGSSSIDAWLLNAAAVRLLGPVKLVTGASRLTAQSLIRLPDAQLRRELDAGGRQPTATRAMAQRFEVIECSRSC